MKDRVYFLGFDFLGFAFWTFLVYGYGSGLVSGLMFVECLVLRVVAGKIFMDPFRYRLGQVQYHMGHLLDHDSVRSGRVELFYDYNLFHEPKDTGAVGSVTTYSISTHNHEKFKAWLDGATVSEDMKED